MATMRRMFDSLLNIYAFSNYVAHSATSSASAERKDNGIE